MGQTKWSFSKVNVSRQCKRKFFFQYVLASHGRKNALRRKAYELGHMKNLEMWQGAVVDRIMTERVIPAIAEGGPLDLNLLAEEAMELAQKQFFYSEHKLYRQPTPQKKNTANEEELEPCILDIHELDKPVNEGSIYDSYDKIRMAILNLQHIKMPDTGKLLLDFLKESKPLIPNLQSWSFEVEGIKVNPQIDLVGYHGFKPYVIDWKVSESLSSDYFRQLAVCGMTVYFDRLKKIETTGKKPFEYSDIRLFKVNLLAGEVVEYKLEDDSVNDIIDTVNLTGGDIKVMEGETWDKVDMAELSCTENEANCHFCNYKTLCSFLYLNNHQYDEKHYLQSIQVVEPAGA